MKKINSALAQRLFVILLFITACSFALFRFEEKPVFYIIGDSTVKNGDGKSANQLQGWGSFIAGYFDTSKIKVENHAIGGRSSRTFLTEGRWDRIMANLKKGDYVIMQFGHNDSGPLDDTARARGSLKGIGDDSVEIYNPIRKMKETVHSYGWYLKKFTDDAKAKGATVLICSPIPRNDWKNGKVLRSDNSYGGWAKEVAKQTNSYFVDLNNLIAEQYEAMGEDKVKPFFPQEHTHTSADGAMLNAKIVVTAIQTFPGCGLNKFLNEKAQN